MKTFGKLNCTLCMNERLEILKAKGMDKFLKNKKMINSSNEIYGACRHKPKFHRYALSTPSSTDEGLTSPKRSSKKLLFDSPFNSSEESDYFSSPQCVPCDPLVKENNGLLVMDC